MTVLEHPPEWFEPEPGECTLNASELATQLDDAKSVEGFARGPGETWTPHAWVERRGKVIDPTWTDANETFEYREDSTAWDRTA